MLNEFATRKQLITVRFTWFFSSWKVQHRDKVQRVHKFACISYLGNIGDSLGESNIKKFCERNDGDFNPPPLFDCIVDVVEVSGKSV